MKTVKTPPTEIDICVDLPDHSYSWAFFRSVCVHGKQNVMLHDELYLVIRITDEVHDAHACSFTWVMSACARDAYTNHGQPCEPIAHHKNDDE